MKGAILGWKQYPGSRKNKKATPNFLHKYKIDRNKHLKEDMWINGNKPGVKLHWWIQRKQNNNKKSINSKGEKDAEENKNNISQLSFVVLKM